MKRFILRRYAVGICAAAYLPAGWVATPWRRRL